MPTMPTVPLAEVAYPVSRSIPVLPGESYRTFGVKWWGAGAYERQTIDGSQTSAKTLNIIRHEDLVINKIWVRHGSVAIAGSEVDGCAASNEFPTFALDTERVSPRWLHWYTKVTRFWHDCARLSQGTSGKNRIRPDRFLSIAIPLPPLAEQQRIVARIDALAARIEEAKGLRAQAVGEVEAITRITARRLVAQVTERPSRLENWLDSERQGIQTGPFGAQLGSGDFVDAGTPLITIGNVQYSGLGLNSLRHVTQQKADELARYDVQEGDILFARMGTVGRCCVVPASAAGWLYNYHLIRVVLDKSKVIPRYVHWSIQSSEDIEAYLGESIRGATRQGVNQEIVAGLPVRIPSMDEQQRIVAYLDELQAIADTVKRLQTETQVELDALLPAVLDRAFRGEL